MAKKFQVLRDKMSPVRKKRSQEYFERLLEEIEKVDPRGKAFYDSLEEYAIDFPEAHELKLSYYSEHPLSLIKLRDKDGAMHSGLTGDYLTLQLVRYLSGETALRVQDCDDGALILMGEEQELAKIKEEIKSLAPLNTKDLMDVWNFQFD